MRLRTNLLQLRRKSHESFLAQMNNYCHFFYSKTMLPFLHCCSHKFDKIQFFYIFELGAVHKLCNRIFSGVEVSGKYHDLLYFNAQLILLPIFVSLLLYHRIFFPCYQKTFLFSVHPSICPSGLDIFYQVREVRTD